jgi:hypothetical protein
LSFTFFFMRASTVKSSHGFVISAKKRAKSYICLSFLASFENVSSVALMHFNGVLFLQWIHVLSTPLTHTQLKLLFRTYKRRCISGIRNKCYPLKSTNHTNIFCQNYVSFEFPIAPLGIRRSGLLQPSSSLIKTFFLIKWKRSRKLADSRAI